MDPGLALSQFTASSIAVFALQKLKAASWFPLVQEGKAGLNTVVAALVAFGTAVGVHYTYDATAHTLLITGLTASGIGTGLWHWLNSFAAQEVIYQAAANKTPVPVAPSNPPAK